MKLTPLDIKKQEFKRTLRGYDPVEVDTFMDMVAAEFEELLKAQKEMRERLLEADVQLREYRKIEKTLQQTLLQAQETTGKTYESARKEAELIVREADQKAGRIVEQAQTDVVRLNNELIQLYARKESAISRLRMLLTSELDLLKTLEPGLEDESSLGGSLGTGKDSIEVESVLRSLDNERSARND